MLAIPHIQIERRFFCRHQPHQRISLRINSGQPHIEKLLLLFEAIQNAADRNRIMLEIVLSQIEPLDVGTFVFQFAADSWPQLFE